MEWISVAGVALLVIFSQIQGVSAAESAIVGITVAGCVSFVMLSVIIGIIVVSFQWRDWFNNWMKRRNKVRMPRWYWQKKEEAKRRLINGSSASHPPSRAPSEINGKLPAQSVDRAGQAVPNHAMKYTAAPSAFQQTSWVQGWSQNNNFNNKAYEEKDVTMVLGDEQEEEFQIETVLVDNETLDVGPFKHDHSNEMALKGEVYNEPYIYSTVDNSKRSFRSQNGSEVPDTLVTPGVPQAAAVTTATTVTTTETKTVEGIYTTTEDGEKVTNIDDMFVHL